MSDEESEHNEASQSEELDDEDEENSPLPRVKNGKTKNISKPIDKAGNKDSSKGKTNASKKDKAAADGSKDKKEDK